MDVISVERREAQGTARAGETDVEPYQTKRLLRNERGHGTPPRALAAGQAPAHVFYTAGAFRSFTFATATTTADVCCDCSVQLFLQSP